ncbi:MAG TPA: hypothetical protein VNJ12_09665 [Candidatus Dormibacteraeota bacterium]|nr:hypothetical protein [Candidatus Dormibacteraeota bacterium]
MIFVTLAAPRAAVLCARQPKAGFGQVALRGGFDNIAGRRNPAVVVNSVDSPPFLAFEPFQGRAFTGRIGFLGRK